ncbi:MAG TPA: S53 family peptidase [Candidatus Angelobacter sp.]|nr:S53 family peptidase [Candidatus Angelobacter sp.]
MRTGTTTGRFVPVAFALLALSALMLTSASAAGPQVKSLGLESPSAVMNVHILLNMRNPEGLKALTQQLQDKNSPNYHKFLTKQQFAAQFAPTAADSLKVANYLKANGLTVTHIDKFNMAVSASGTVANLQRTFNTQIEKVQLNGQTFSRPMTAPTVSAAISPLVKSVSGLHTMKAKSYAVQQVTYKNKKAVAPTPVKFVKTKPHGVFFPGDCFSVSNDVLNLHGPGLQAIYSGNQYPDPGCGYAPAEMQHGTGFDTAIAAGNDGTGQYITIVDPYGSPSITTDANAFSAIYGLPALVPGVNFFILDNPTNGIPDCVESPSSLCGWEIETTLDVEWAHAMAPGASIILVNPPTANFSDLWATDLWIADSLPTGTVSHSFGASESEVWYYDYPDFVAQYEVNAIAASLGVSNNYSTGDGGDIYGAGVFVPTDVSFPSGSPDATAVGGTSLALDSSGNYKWEEGWGSNVGLLFYAPPFSYFYAGSGGGTSQVGTPPNAAQAFYLNNTYRQQPDVSMDADPFTGVEIIYTGDFNPGDPQYVAVYGGTSLSCPMFSAVWALVGQKVGTPYLGTAAPFLYEQNALFPGSFNDVVPSSSGHNAHGTVFFGNTPVAYSQWDLAGPYQNSPVFYESIWNAQEISVTFGTDSSLFTAPGWDNVTGIGTPAGANFLAPY